MELLYDIKKLYNKWVDHCEEAPFGCINGLRNVIIKYEGRDSEESIPASTISMTFDKYQQLASITAIYDRCFEREYLMDGITSEVGELAGKIKKVLRDNHGNFTSDKLAEICGELGDIQWYLAMLARHFGYPLSVVAERNIAKLADRAERNVIQGSGDER